MQSNTFFVEVKVVRDTRDEEGAWCSLEGSFAY